MASKFIIFAVFAVAAQSAAAVDGSTLVDVLSTIRSSEVATHSDLASMVNHIFDSLDGTNYSPSELKEIEEIAARYFRNAYEKWTATLRIISENPDVIDAQAAGAHDALNRVISTIMSMLGETDTSEREEEAVEQIKSIWRQFYLLFTEAVDGTEEMNEAIEEIRILATDNAECATRAISTAIRFANKQNPDKYKQQIELQRQVALVTKVAELIENMSFMQYIRAYRHGAGHADVASFIVIVKNAKKVIFAFRELFEIAANAGAEEDFDAFEEIIYGKFIIALDATLESINSIQSGVSVEIDRTEVLEKLRVAVDGIRKAAEIASGKVLGNVEEFKAQVVDNVQSAFESIYAALAEASRQVPDAEAEINDAANDAAAGIKEVFDYLFAAMTDKLPEGIVMTDLEFVVLEVEVMRKFDFMRGCCLATSLQNKGVQVPLSLLLNDAVKTVNKNEL